MSATESQISLGDLIKQTSTRIRREAEQKLLKYAKQLNDYEVAHGRDPVFGDRIELDLTTLANQQQSNHSLMLDEEIRLSFDEVSVGDLDRIPELEGRTCKATALNEWYGAGNCVSISATLQFLSESKLKNWQAENRSYRLLYLRKGGSFHLTTGGVNVQG